MGVILGVGVIRSLPFSRPCLQSLPVLLVDLARVCGFRVRGGEEAEAVSGKIRAALHESFLERSEELFEVDSAVHADTASLEEVSENCRIPQQAEQGGGGDTHDLLESVACGLTWCD